MKSLLEGNAAWAERVAEKDPTFFSNLEKGQQPEYLWIGCADSRVPATQITDMVPGSIFVHRNIANVVQQTDTNLMSVLFYAVTVLKVKHVVVCGHYGCGGVKAAMDKSSFGFLDSWLAELKRTYDQNGAELNAIGDEDQRFTRFVELNVQAGVQNLARVSFIQETWSQGEFPYIHGMVYGLGDGKLRNLDCTINSAAGLESIYRFEK